ncbi:oxidoreductase-like protein [Aspergillus cavernicola]|uniref:Oxidoreductase-like protein n=1 Tax=Aspergillus cavernicola TaxID=176166 RepID=A0ABR4IXB8_9EURO
MAIVFGTRLAGPGRSSRYDPGSSSTWKTVNGVPIPARPAEPDNCCMSGCVHCVWDDYRDEMEEWAAILAQAKAKGPSKSPKVIPGAIPKSPDDAASTGMSMDDDGGGSETNWSAPGSGDDLFADIPVGIREFMRTEKRLKEVHRQERNAL